MTKKRVTIVDEEDQIIGSKKRGTILQEDIYRVSALWVENSKGDVLLAQRKFTKKNSPGKWGPAVAGTVEEDETYESNIYKEAEEEIGLVGVTFTKREKVRRSGEHNYFCQWFFVCVDKDLDEFVIQEEEVEQIAWLSKEVLKKEVMKTPDQYLSSIRSFVGVSV